MQSGPQDSGLIDLALMNCMEKVVLSVVAELCEREVHRLDRELVCMIAGTTLPRRWGNPEVRPLATRHAEGGPVSPRQFYLVGEHKQLSGPSQPIRMRVSRDRRIYVNPMRFWGDVLVSQ